METALTKYSTIWQGRFPSRHTLQYFHPTSQLQECRAKIRKMRASLEVILENKSFLDFDYFLRSKRTPILRWTLSQIEKCHRTQQSDSIKLVYNYRMANLLQIFMCICITSLCIITPLLGWRAISVTSFPLVIFALNSQNCFKCGPSVSKY